MKYGEFLVSKNLVTEDQISSALIAQRHSKLPLGKIAVQLGYVSKLDNIKILLEQDKSGDRYGDVAIRMGLLDNDKISEILRAQKAETVPIGKVLVEEKILTRLESVRALAEYTNLVDEIEGNT
jgi:hypothetical protein